MSSIVRAVYFSPTRTTKTIVQEVRARWPRRWTPPSKP